MNDKSQDMCSPSDFAGLTDEQLSEVSGGVTYEEDEPITLPPCSRCGGPTEIYIRITYHMAKVVCKECSYLEIVKIS